MSGLNITLLRPSRRGRSLLSILPSTTPPYFPSPIIMWTAAAASTTFSNRHRQTDGKTDGREIRIGEKGTRRRRRRKRGNKREIVSKPLSIHVFPFSFHRHEDLEGGRQSSLPSSFALKGYCGHSGEGWMFPWRSSGERRGGERGGIPNVIPFFRDLSFALYPPPSFGSPSAFPPLVKRGKEEEEGG